MRKPADDSLQHHVKMHLCTPNQVLLLPLHICSADIMLCNVKSKYKKKW